MLPVTVAGTTSPPPDPGDR
ncbi:hypothetical protein A2U01_0111463, partial [Trifolium medium]|nr:hypothetical protein [Trifolium medium]